MDDIGNSPVSESVPAAGAIALSEPNEVNRLSDWEIDFRQIEPGQMKTTVSLHAGAIVKLLEITMSRAVHQTGLSPRGSVTVGLVRPQQLETWQGSDLTSTELVCFGEAAEFDGVGVSSFRGLTISVETEAIEEIADAFGLEVPDALWKSGLPQIGRSRQPLRALHILVERLRRNRSYGLCPDDEEQVVLALLAAANSGSRFADKSAPRLRVRSLARALEMMAGNDCENIPIGRICRETGTSWRTLDRAFNEKFGIGPKRYYLNLRLNRVRSRMLHGDDCATVSDGANAYGFWHLGEFAHEYFSLFGELPSDTLSIRL